MIVESPVHATVHPENIVAEPAPPTAAETGPSGRTIVTGIACGWIGATLAVGALWTGIAGGDTAGAVCALTLAVSLTAIVCSWAASMIEMVWPDKKRSP